MIWRRGAFSSLRVRLPLIFIGGIVVAALVTTAIAVQLFQSYAREQTVNQLRRESNGIARLFANSVAATYGTESRRAPTFAARNLEAMTGDRIYWDGPLDPFPGEKS